MYSGSTLTRYSGRILGAHQKIDRVARRRVAELCTQSQQFPTIRHILHFEGINGPDAIKRKSPAKGEPWHYINPFDSTDTQLYDIIVSHYQNLVTSLRENNSPRAAFEAAWLAHAIVDGMTPAHHYPYEEKLAELRSGQDKETRTTFKEKLLMHGDSRYEQLKNNWKMWGPRGLFMTHLVFEWGVATMIAPMSSKSLLPTPEGARSVEDTGFIPWYCEAVREIAKLDLYGEFYRHGWTRKLANTTKQLLVPKMIEAVALSWYCALQEAQAKKPPS